MIGAMLWATSSQHIAGKAKVAAQNLAILVQYDSSLTLYGYSDIHESLIPLSPVYSHYYIWLVVSLPLKNISHLE